MAEDLDRPIPLWLSIVACVVFVPPLFIGMVMLIGVVIDSRAEYVQQRDQCLKRATNGYEIRECR
jgi:hypothetical protein